MLFFVKRIKKKKKLPEFLQAFNDCNLKATDFQGRGPNDFYQDNELPHFVFVRCKHTDGFVFPLPPNGRARVNSNMSLTWLIL